jgi:hypothetical protein
MKAYNSGSKSKIEEEHDIDTEPPLAKMKYIRDGDGNVPHYLCPLEDPSWIGADRASHMRPDDPVLGLVFDRNAWALPWRIMRTYHVANLVMDGRPILVWRPS